MRDSEEIKGAAEIRRYRKAVALARLAITAIILAIAIVVMVLVAANR
ncbi:MAG: hypothetical protein RR415_12355 [Ruthenibacterium sp.]